MKTLNVMLLRMLTVLAVCFALAGCLRSSDSNDDDLVEEDSSEEVGGDDVADSGDTGDSSGDDGGTPEPVEPEHTGNGKVATAGVRP